MKDTHFFILGRSPQLSVAEIDSVLHVAGKSYGAWVVSDNVAVMQGDMDAESMMAKLGGTIKAGSVIRAMGTDKIDPEWLAAQIVSDGNQGKITFGLSAYNLDSPEKRFRSFVRGMMTLGLQVKQCLRGQGRPARMVAPKGRDSALSSVAVAKNKVLKRGAELVFILGKEEILIAKTAAVQAFESFSKRDYGRPARDIERGMLPPKIARIMVNLSQAPADGVILDPFCGTGTVAQEALDLGYRRIECSDLDSGAVRLAKENLEWFANDQDIDTKDVRIRQGDAIRLQEHLKEGTADAIVTEPLLGPLLRGREPETELRRIVSELEPLYGKAFASFAKVLKKQGRVVIIFPVLGKGARAMHLNILQDLATLGFKAESPSPSGIARLTDRGSIVYSRPGQAVAREIFVFIRK